MTETWTLQADRAWSRGPKYAYFEIMNFKKEGSKNWKSLSVLKSENWVLRTYKTSDSRSTKVS